MISKTYHSIGLMSGSSLDGLDIAYCTFRVSQDDPKQSPKVEWQLVHAETVPFSEQWVARLYHLPKQDALSFSKTHTYFGHYMGELVNAFIQKNYIDPDFIASHGHTVFHYPDQRMTMQIGDGAALAAVTGFPVINNFRTQDIAINGEGTPLAPIADKLLFEGYDFYMNIGGIANITCNANGKFIAFDTAPANQVLNALALQLGFDFDKDGAIAAKATMDQELFGAMQEIDYFTLPYPKSLDNSWIQQSFLPTLMQDEASSEDKLRTYTDFIAYQTAQSIEQIILTEKIKKSTFKLFITGGGALNTFLINSIQKYCNEKQTVEIIIPERNIIEFKEAVLMALMGVLRVENIPNCMQSVTGAKRDTIGGAIFQGSKKTI